MVFVNWRPDDKQLRQFAVIALFGFGLIGFLLYHWTGSTAARSALWLVGVVTFLVGLPFPTAIRPVYVLVTAVSLPIGLVVSAVALRILFYGVVTPFGLLLRLRRRDPLQRKRPADATTYWKERVQSTDATSYLRQS